MTTVNELKAKHLEWHEYMCVPWVAALVAAKAAGEAAKGGE